MCIGKRGESTIPNSDACNWVIGPATQCISLIAEETRVASLLMEKGWWGRAEMEDPLTGKIKNVQLGSTRRLKVIYDTNLRTAHSEGQWQRIQRNKDDFPYLKYDANNSEHPRLEHSAWDGLVLPVDDPFWQAHYPVKAWGCKCGVVQLDEDTLDELGLKPAEPPQEETYTYINKRTGEMQRIPKGVDPSFNYPPGGRLANLNKMLADKIDRLQDDLKTVANERIKKTGF